MSFKWGDRLRPQLDFFINNFGFICCRCKSAIKLLEDQRPICPKCGLLPVSFGDIIDFNNAELNDKTIYDREYKYDYIFVFSEPLAVTDIQYEELYCLLRRYPKDNHPVVISIAESGEPKSNSDNCTVEIVRFEHSCRVRSKCEFDVYSIVRNSGYIHSAGPAIYVEEWSKVDSNSIVDKLKAYSEKNKKRYKLHFYTDQKETEDEKKIEGIAIDYFRTYIGTMFFHEEKKYIESEVKDYCLDKNFQEGGVVFIYRDTFHVNNQPFLYPEQNDIHYMVIYHSLCKKENPLHQLDENRPYWAGIYTTPHDLTCAMVNMARVKAGDIVYDPFLHMGTTAIEAAKFGCCIIGSDLVEPLGALDNYNFVFHDKLGDVIERIDKLFSEKYHERCYELASSNLTRNKGLAFPEPKPIELMIEKYPELEDYEKRLLFYIVRRFILRQQQGRDEKLNLEAFIKYQIGEFNKYHELNQYNLQHPEGWIPDDTTSRFVNDQTIKSYRLGPERNQHSQFIVFKANARKFPLNDNSVDAIVTDPPYGYGDDIPAKDLKNLYRDFISESFRVLRNGGRLVMCMLDKVKTGKFIHKDTMTKGVVGLINRIANEKGIRFGRAEVLPLSPVPSLNYWKSKYALNRAIIHLEIIKEAGNGN